MTIPSKCAKCGGAPLFPAMVVEEDRRVDNELQLRVDARPQAFVFKGAHRSAVGAIVCSRCGYVELYVADPQTLYEAHREAESQG